MLLSLPCRGPPERGDAPAAFGFARARAALRGRVPRPRPLPAPADARWSREHRAGCSVQYLHKLGTHVYNTRMHTFTPPGGTPIVRNDRKTGRREAITEISNVRRQRRGPVQGHRHRAAIANAEISKVSDAVASLGVLRKLAAGNW